MGDRRHPISGSMGLEGGRAVTRWVAEAFGWTILLGGLFVLMATSSLVGELARPGSPTAVLSTLGVTLVAAIGVCAGTAVVVASAASPDRRVFRARSLAVVTIALLPVLAILLGSLVVDPPFGDLFRSLRIGASDVVDLGRLVAAAAVFVGLASTLGEYRVARHDERTCLRDTGPAP